MDRCLDVMLAGSTRGRALGWENVYMFVGERCMLLLCGPVCWFGDVHARVSRAVDSIVGRIIARTLSEGVAQLFLRNLSVQALPVTFFCVFCLLLSSGDIWLTTGYHFCGFCSWSGCFYAPLLFLLNLRLMV